MTYNALLLAKNCIDDTFENVFLWCGWLQFCHQSVCFCYVICQTQNRNNKSTASVSTAQL